MEEEIGLIVNELLNLEILKEIAEQKTQRFPKTVEESEKKRKEGNTLFIRKDHDIQMHENIFKCYTKSITSAPKNSEQLALGFGNRSAFLFHVKKYKECILDIDRALKMKVSESLKKKLESRKENCINILNKQSNDPNKITVNNSPELQNKFSQIAISQQKSFLEDLSKNNSYHKTLSIKYNTKYGRHIVATRKIEPGEIIFTQKPYVCFINIKKTSFHCCHCLSVTWTGIPCDSCGWFVFCSNECKNEAWKLYHSIECSLLPHIVHFLGCLQDAGETVVLDGLSIRALLKGLTEYSSFEKLKADVICIANSKDRHKNGFSKNGNFESDKFKSLFSLSGDCNSEELKSHVKFAAVTLICLAKYTSFFGKVIETVDLKKLASNPDFILTGAIILRLARISSLNSHYIMNVNDVCKYGNDIDICKKNLCCVRGVSITPLASLTNNSCVPNARRCFTDSSQFILYALRPIMKNDQIFDSYYCSFYESPNPLRINNLMLNFNFKCNCLACIENWKCFPVTQTKSQNLCKEFTLSPKETDIWKNYREIIGFIEKETIHFDHDLLNTLSNAVSWAEKKLSTSSVVNCKLMATLILVFEKLYGYKFLTFDKCDE